MAETTLDVDVDVVAEDARWRGMGLEALAGRAAAATLAHLGLTGPASIVILGCDDDRIAALNADFRGRPSPTNVLSWPSQERGAVREGARPVVPAAGELGDIAIAWETCAREAAAAGLPMTDHSAHLIVHATLHLLGYDHVRDGDASLMEQLEVEILGKLGVPDPYSR